MDKKKGNFSSNSIDQEMDIGDCSDGEDKGEGDDEEDDDMDEDIESEDDVGSAEEVVDEEDNTIEAMSVASSNSIGNTSPHAAVTTTVCESSPPRIKFSICKDSNNSKPSDDSGNEKRNEKKNSSQPECVSSIEITEGKKLAVKFKRSKGGVYSCNDRTLKSISNGTLDTAKDDRISLHPEKWGGKVCSLCNLGERSQLGQGVFVRVKIPDSMHSIEKSPEISVSFEETAKVLGTSTPKNKKCNKIALSLFEPVDELGIVGYNDKINIPDLFDEEGYIYIHQYCALFSCKITYDSGNELVNVIPGVLESLSRVCFFCNRFGASVPCSYNNCEKFFHFPCAAAAAGFLHLKCSMYFCTSHINHVSLLPSFDGVSCRKCCILGNVSNLIMCSACGSHYHGGCVGLASLPGNRTGWQCQDCRICQVCRSTEEASKEVTCETCHKMYHATCLRPVLTSIPKFGWKCKCCRKCNDCGSRTPGSGYSSRWHCHYTVCDSCYQQRNKGFSCPLCHRAYRAGSSKEMTQCSSCKKFVHRTCDSEADSFTYHKKNEMLPDYQYICPMCKNMSQLNRLAVKRKDSFEEPTTDMSMNASQESLTLDDMDVDYSDKDEFKYSGGFGLGKGKPLTARKKMQLNSAKKFRSKHMGKAATNGFAYQKRNQKITEFGKKRCTKSKIRGVFGIPGLGLQRPCADSQNKSDNDNNERKIILCSESDGYCLSQDLCAMCGALGTDQEGCLISCVQCGQCYHPYCVDVKVTKAILQKGWRCLDCMICEVCGKKDDDPVLILCDDCNMSYHITCVGLFGVPEGPWKCKWCAQCLTCGATEPGVNCSWSENYTECGPCSSRSTCPSCNMPYNDGDLIIKCDCCERWLHGLCDQMKTEKDAEKCAEEGYTCLLCRPKDFPPPHLALPPPKSLLCTTPKLKIKLLSPVKISDATAVKEEMEHLVDGTYLWKSGMNLMMNLLSAIDMNVPLNSRKKKRSAFPATDQAQNQQRKGIRKLGVGGFDARNKNVKSKGKNDREEEMKDQIKEKASTSSSALTALEEKPRRKKIQRKPKSKFAECYPSYIQNAFFGRELLDTSTDALNNLGCSDSECDESLSVRRITESEMVTLSEKELKIMEKAKARRDEIETMKRKTEEEMKHKVTIKAKKEERQGDENLSSDNDNEAFKDILNISDNLLNTIMNDEETSLKANPPIIEEDSNMPNEPPVNNCMSNNLKDEFSDILGPNFSIESIVQGTALPNMDSKDVEEIFKGVSSGEPQTSHTLMIPEIPSIPIPSNKYHVLNHSNSTAAGNQQQSVIIAQSSAATPPSLAAIQGSTNVIPTRNPPNQAALLTSQQNTPSPVAYPSVSPYHSEYSTSPSQFSPACSEPPSPWVQEDSSTMDSAGTSVATALSYNQKNAKKAEEDENLGENATISMVLFANLKYPELKMDYPVWSDRYKQIQKKWRTLTTEQKQPFLTQAKENRTKFSRGRKVQQESEKIAPLVSKIRESDEEKQWKQMQARRQQQVNSQQQQLIDSRMQNQPRILQPSRPIGVEVNDNATLFPSGAVVDPKVAPLQVSGTQEVNVAPALTSPGRLQQHSPFPSPKLKVPTNQNATYQRIQSNEVFIPPNTPRRQFFVAPSSQNPQLQINQGLHQVSLSNPERSRQLCELIQRQQQRQQQLQIQPHPVESMPPDQQNTARLWVQDASGQQQVVADTNSNQESLPSFQASNNSPMQVFENVSNVDATAQPFRPPLPPTVIRTQQRLTPQQQIFIQQHQQRISQPVDSRLRFLMQEQHRLAAQHQMQQRHPMQAQQLQQQNALRVQQQQLIKFQQQLQLQQQLQQQSHLQQQHQIQQQTQQPVHIVRPPTRQIFLQSQIASQQTLQPVVQNSSQLSYSEQAQNILNGTALKEEFPQYAQRIEKEAGQNGNAQHQSDRVDAQNEGIPESVTADLDALEREDVPGTMSEMSALFGDLNEDELFAEMGAGFDLLKYTDPELDNLASGNTSNILYDLVSSTSDSTKAKNENDTTKRSNKDQAAPSEAIAPPQAGVKLEKEIVNEGMQQKQGQIHADNLFDTKESILQEASMQKQNSLVTPPLTLRQRQQIIQMQKINLKDTLPIQLLSAAGVNPQAMHQLPTRPQSTLGLSSVPMTPRPTSNSAPATPITPATPPSQPSTPLERDMPAHPNDGRVSTATPPPPPPPPYPGPPPPYPSQLKQQLAPQHMQSQMISSPLPNVVGVHSGHPVNKLEFYSQAQVSRRPLLLQEQPLLLEDLVEQEKREQSKQAHLSTDLPPLSDAEFERLRADVLKSSAICGTTQTLLVQESQKSQHTLPAKLNPGKGFEQQIWQQQIPSVSTIQASNNIQTFAQRVPLFKARTLTAPPEPPDNIVNEQDSQVQQAYERWLIEQNMAAEEQKKYYETEVAKLRKLRKNIKSKQRGLEKQGSKLGEQEDQELKRLLAEISCVQKLCDSSRKHAKQHAAIVQDYKNKHRNFNSPLSENSSGSSTPMKVTPTSGKVSQQAQQVYSSTPPLSNKSPTLTVFNQNMQQTEEMYTVGGIREQDPNTLQPPATTIMSQIRAGVKPPQQILRYPSNTQLRFVQTVRHKSGEVLTFQVPADSVRAGSGNSILYQGLRHPLKTQPLIVSTVSNGSSGNFVTANNTNQTNTYVSTAGGQDKDVCKQTLHQLKPEPQKKLSQQRSQLSQQNIDPSLLAQRHRRMVQVPRQAVPQQGNVPARIPQFAQPLSPVTQQMQQHAYQMHPPPNSFNQPPNSPMPTPSQSPRSAASFVHPSNSPVPSHSPQPPSPMAMSSPRHMSQFVHSNSQAPSHSPIYQTQYPTRSPIPVRSPVLSRRPPSVENFSQDGQQADVHSMNMSQGTYNANSENTNSNNSRGGGSGTGFVNCMPIPEAFVRLGIKPGLLGGTPTWQEKPGNKEGRKTEQSVTEEVNPDFSSAPPSTTIEQDQGSQDSSLFSAYRTKALLKQESPESPSDVESSELCATPKTEDGVDLHVYKDVPLMNGYKSDENSLGVEDFASHIAGGETLVLDPEALRLTLDPSDEQSENLLRDCLASSDLLVLNMSEDHDGIMNDISEIGSILYMDKIEDGDLANIAKIKTEEAELEVETPEKKKLADVEEKIDPENTSSMVRCEMKGRNDEQAEETKSEELVTSCENTAEDGRREPIENISKEVEDHADLITNTYLPVRTSSVLQMAAFASNPVPAAYSNLKLPVYIENFHSYVKKPKTVKNKSPHTEEDTISEVETQQSFQETLSNMKTEEDFALAALKDDDSSKPTPTIVVNQNKNIESESQKSLPSNMTNGSELEPRETTVKSKNLTNNTTEVKRPKSAVELKIPEVKNVDKPSTIQPPQTTIPRIRPNDDSQNVLLKQLLQNSSNFSMTHATMTQHVAKPPPISQILTHRSLSVTTTVERATAATAETTAPSTYSTEGTLVKIEKIVPEKEVDNSTNSAMKSVTDSVQDLFPVPCSTPTSLSGNSTSSEGQVTISCPTVNTMLSVIREGRIASTSREIKKQITTSVPTSSTLVTTDKPVPHSSNMSPIHIDIKKEGVADELISPVNRAVDAGDTPNSISGDSSSGSILDPQELKKLKRRQYQAKRRQNQVKDHASGIPKKRARKASKIEDYSYDTFVDNLMTKLRQLPPLPITEPLLTHNYVVCLPFGAGDPSKINPKSWINGELVGSYGNFALSGQDDYYNTEPLGDEEPLPPSAVPSTTRGFYNEEFPPLNLEADYEERRLDLARADRELDTPDSIVSSSSPECIMTHMPARFAGLRLINENGSGPDSEDDERLSKRVSPIIPLVAPLALKPRVHYYMDFDKENYGNYLSYPIKSRLCPQTPLKDTGNVSVTLTLNSEAAQNIVGVLKNLATVLNISPPSSYKILDRVSSPNKVNPFGDCVEDVELEKYLDGSIKVCSFCEVQISSHKSVRKRVSEVPFVVQDGVSEDLLFCSSSCYLQMVLLVPPVTVKEKGSDINENSLEPSPYKKKRLEKSEDESIYGETDRTLNLTDGRTTDESMTEGSILSGSVVGSKSDQPLSEKRPVRGIKYRTWSSNSIPPPNQKYKKPTEKEVTETLFRMGITVTPKKMLEDSRQCIFCHQIGDSVADGPSRLLNYDVDKWVHLNCSLWSDGVYETVNGALVNVDAALRAGMNVICTYCNRPGATLKCFKLRCSSIYHLSCAVKHDSVFYKNKALYCNAHVPKSEKDNELTTLAVYRRVYIDRDDDRQIASIVQHAELTHLLRIGSLICISVGQLLPHQLEEFHSPKYIYPIGYKVIRFYWSTRIFNKRCQYVCSIHEMSGRPEFRILVQEPGEEDIEFRDATPKAVWTRILEPLENLRRTNDSVKLFHTYVTGEDLFGLEEPAIVRILESLPGIDTLSDYQMKYGKNPLLELPLAVNPSGCARCEPRVRGPPIKRAYTQRTSSVMSRPVLTSSPLFFGDLSCPYSKHFVHSKSSQYKKMKQEWRNNVYLARSKIQGLGLYAARDIDKHTMVIEYIGEIIRSQLSDWREKQYEAKNRGIYMFRLDENRVVDATVCGGLARYINHSCNPNCVTEKVEVDREYRIIILSKRRIARGEELSYDYQFDIEDDSQKIPCLCGAPNCRKWMN